VQGLQEDRRRWRVPAGVSSCGSRRSVSRRGRGVSHRRQRSGCGTLVFPIRWTSCVLLCGLGCARAAAAAAAAVWHCRSHNGVWAVWDDR
jgi:hypothetical protein